MINTGNLDELTANLDGLTARLAKKMLQVSQDIGYVGKDGVNPQGWKYASIEAIVGAVNDACFRHGVCVWSKVVAYENKVIQTKVTNKHGDLVDSISIFTEVHLVANAIDIDTGHSISTSAIGIGLNNQDKGPGQAMSYARKFALLNLFNIARGDDPDAQDSDPVKVALNPPPKVSQAPKIDERGYNIRIDAVFQKLDQMGFEIGRNGKKLREWAQQTVLGCEDWFNGKPTSEHLAAIESYIEEAGGFV